MWKFDVFKDEDGGWRWRLIQGNTLIVVESSQIFERLRDAKQAAEKARGDIAVAPIVSL